MLFNLDKKVGVFHFILLMNMVYILNLSSLSYQEINENSIEEVNNKEETYSSVDAYGVPFDHKLIQKMGFEKGIFIEVGANDGITQSNTYLLEKKYNWSGILIEPSSNIFELLCSNRPKSICYNCALGAFSENNTYIEGDFDGALMSSVGGQRLKRSDIHRPILMRSLQSILEEINIFHINLFSLDVEGYEYQILQGIDFNKTTFDYLLIEIYLSEYDQIVSFLEAKGYELIEMFSMYDDTLPNWDGTHNDYLFKRKIL